jgi:ESF2/ABP1 family protein
LTGQIAAEDAERASRMRAELTRAAKSDREFVQNIEQSKQVTGIEKKRKERDFKESEIEARPVGQRLGEARRSFRQVPLAKKRRTEDQDPSAEVTRVLSNIF